MRIVETEGNHHSSLYLRVRFPILLTIAALLGIKSCGDLSVLPVVLSGVLVVFAFLGRWAVPVSARGGRIRGAMLVAEVGTCLVATLYCGLFAVLGVPFGIILISSFQSLTSRLKTGIYTGILISLTFMTGHLLIDGIGQASVLTLAAVILATGAIAIVFSSRIQRMTSALEQMQVDLARQKLEGEATSENIVRLYEASQATSQEAEPGGIMDTLVEDATRLIGCESASAAIFIEKDLLASVTKGISQEFKRNLRWRVRKGGMTDRVLTTGNPLVINGAQTDPRSRDSSAVRIGNLQSIMAVPLATGNEVFGILYVGDAHDKKFGDRDLMLLTILANHAAASIRQTRLRRELKKKLEELESAHKELIGADRLKAEFISAVTSQMRVPLDAIKTYSQTVLNRLDDKAFKLKEKFLGAVVEETVKLLSTVNGVIDLSRMEFGEGDLRMEETNIADILRDVCTVLEPLYVDHQVEVVVDAPPNPAHARVDRGMVFLLFRNLLEAAIGFTREDTRLRITLDEDQSFLTTRITITPSPASLEVESVVRAVSGKEAIPTDAGSLGLTLQVAKNIVFRHGGRIWAETHDPSSWSLVVLFGKEKRAILPSDLMLEIMTSRPELKRMLALVADMISKVMGVGRCQLFLEDSATGELVLGASVDYDPPGQDRLVVGKGEGLTGAVFEEG
ncbi:MAG: GAF domain-containing sensor histidine kinase, partial [Candidatus Eisenbacteria bacterium]